MTAGLLALSLGGLEAHKFFLGKPGLGVLYRLFFWTFIPAVVAVVEGILFRTMSDDAFRGKFS